MIDSGPQTEQESGTGRSDHPDPRAAGLSTEDARRRLAEQGPNVIREEKGPSALREFLANLVQPLELLLWAAAVLGILAQEPQLTVAIVLVILINAVFAFLEEYRAERTMQALRRMMPIQAHVRRDGEVVDIPSEEVVRGDVLVLKLGDRIAADADLLTGEELRVDESALTGESAPIEPKDHVFAGTYVTRGDGQAVATATGMDTRFGHIAALSQRTKHVRSPIEKKIGRVTQVVAVLAVTIGVLFFFVAGYEGMRLTDRFVFAIGVTVSVVPNGLLSTVTLSLALATQRMAKRNALVRRLSSVETLGEVTVICTDKTGTLTENQMTVQRLCTPFGVYTVEGTGYEPFGRFRTGGQVVDPAPLRELLRAGLLCNDARLTDTEQGWSVLGDPSEGGLVVVAEKGGLHQKLEAAHAPRLFEVPFSSERKRMTTVHLVGSERVAYTKGAVEVVLPRTTLGPEARAEIMAAAAAMEHDALHVLALTRHQLPEDFTSKDAGRIEQDVEFLGLVGMIDPPRAAVPEAVRRCAAAGIRIIMVTGDSPRTAEAVARLIGMAQGEVHVITGPELAGLADSELRRRLKDKRDVIFARIDPEQKLRLATVLRDQGETVAMTGDGVNDAPALKHADIGVAMGRGGTEVAKEAADIVLIDDNFASIVAAVEEGRAVYDNMRRCVGYHFCSDMGELVTFLVWGVSIGLVPLPLTVMQVLANDVGTNQVPAMGLGSEPAEPGTMTRPPRPRSEPLLDRAMWKRILLVLGLLDSIAAMASFFFVYVLAGWRPGHPLAASGTLYRQATTMTMGGLVMGQIGGVMAWRTNRESVRTVGLFSNRLVLAGIAVAVAVIALLSYTPGLERIFGTSALSGWDWLFLLVWPPVVLALDEARKAAIRRWQKRRIRGGTLAAAPRLEPRRSW
ncbi:MAG TPA: cation-transporting P-type ATPase [Polyangiaceae bacterium]|nr:cation-transporting P-type ATPase [Polyangiaceae bacterium]